MAQLSASDSEESHHERIGVTLFGARCDAYYSNTFVIDGKLFFGSSAALDVGGRELVATVATGGYPFGSDIVGKRIVVAGAGANGTNLITTVARYVNAAKIILSDAASTAVANAAFSFGTDDHLPLQKAIQWISRSPTTRQLLIGPRLCATSAPLLISQDYVSIKGTQHGGTTYDNAVGPPRFSSGLVWLGRHDGTILRVRPDPGPTSPALHGVSIMNLGVAANNLAAFGLDISGVQSPRLQNITATEARLASIFVHGGAYQLGGYCGVQHGSFSNIFALNVTSSGLPIVEEGNTTCNPNFNKWERVAVTHLNSDAFRLVAVDNEDWDIVTSRKISGGRAEYSMVFGCSSGFCSTTNRVNHFSADLPPHAEPGASDNWMWLDKANGTPSPKGQSIYWIGSNGASNIPFAWQMSQTFAVTPSKGWSIDNAGVTITLPAGGTYAFQAGSGRILLNDSSNNGAVAEFLCGGNSCVLVAQSTGNFFVAGNPNPYQIGIVLNESKHYQLIAGKMIVDPTILGVLLERTRSVQ
jgi:hypothetical protein